MCIRDRHLRYINEKSSILDEDLELAVKMFVDSFYDGDESILERALNDPEFKKIKESS